MTGSVNDSLVSIIVPVYNAEKYIDNCVTSVVNQTYSKWELLLIDDGSFDSSGMICDNYSRLNSRIRVVHQKNLGVSAARNRGIECAEGEYIAFLDVDDALPQESLKTLVNSLIDNNADVAMGITCGEKWENHSGVEIWKGEDGIRYSLMDDPYTCAAWGKLYRRELIGETRFDREIKINEDSLFVFQIMCKKPVCVCVNKEIYQYIQVSGSASRSDFSEKYFDILKVSDLKYKKIEEQFPQMHDLAKNMLLKARMNVLRLLAVRTRDEYRDVEKKLLEYILDNKEDYIPSSKECNQWMFILSHHLFYVYKFAHYIVK
uniref:glycosyltransferase n=1 Tax=Faecalibacterium prausnitzii TaxID=853 RepID=UPI003FF051F5